MKFLILIIVVLTGSLSFEIDPRKTKLWGPGLLADQIVLPARYFFIHAVDINNTELTSSPGKVFQVTFSGESSLGRYCRAWLNLLDRGDGSFIARYKLYQSCFNFQINVMLGDSHVADSPYKVKDTVHPEECHCPKEDFNDWFNQYKCNRTHKQIDEDLKPFKSVNFDILRDKIIQKYDQPARSSFCNYRILNNEIYRKCYGQHVGFKMFTDSILLSLARKVKLPNMELFTNLGDWPLVLKRNNSADETLPMFSWCGSDDSLDIVLPTYEITESTLENMGRVMLDMLSVQSHAGAIPWTQKEPRAFWRGRDSRRERLMLIDIARKHPDLFNVSLTNFFFFRDQEEHYGPKSKHISLFEFFNNKYLLNIDGTVAAYRFPYLLVGNSLVIKQDSKYYEYFYKDLHPWEHYVPIAHDLHDLVEKINWATENDADAQRISMNAQRYAKENLLPHHVICYHAALFREWALRVTSTVYISDSMEHVPQPVKESINCQCEFVTRDEL